MFQVSFESFPKATPALSLAAYLALSSIAVAQTAPPVDTPPSGTQATTAPAAPPAPRRGTVSEAGETEQFDITVTAARLDQARNQISTSVGASTYEINQQAIDTQPLGNNAPLNQTLLQAPGVAQDSYRPAACARRPRQLAIPHQRHHHSGDDQRLLAVVRDALRAAHRSSYWRLARPIRLPHGRYCRDRDEERFARSWRRDHSLWRPEANILSELLLWRLDRHGRLFRLRQLSPEQYRHRKPDPLIEPCEGLHRAGQGLPLSLHPPRSRYETELHIGQRGQPVSPAQ